MQNLCRVSLTIYIQKIRWIGKRALADWYSNAGPELEAFCCGCASLLRLRIFGEEKKAILSFRLRLHSCLRQSGGGAFAFRDLGLSAQAGICRAFGALKQWYPRGFVLKWRVCDRLVLKWKVCDKLLSKWRVSNGLLKVEGWQQALRGGGGGEDFLCKGGCSSLRFEELKFWPWIFTCWLSDPAARVGFDPFLSLIH